MADDLPVLPSTDPSAKSMRAEEIASKLYQGIRLWLGGAGVAIRAASNFGVAGDDVLRTVHANDDPLVTILLGGGTTCTTQVVRPGNTTPFTIDDAFADATTGGFSLVNAARISGGSGIITDVFLVGSNDPGTKLQAELWIFDSAVTAMVDNAAWSLSDGDAAKAVARIPFTLESGGAAASYSFAQVQGSWGFTCVGSADLRFMIKVKNAYVPANAETLTVRAKITRSN